MGESDVEVRDQIDAILNLLAQALDGLVEDQSPYIPNIELQIRAAQQALLAVRDDADARVDLDAVNEIAARGVRPAIHTAGPSALLAEAERDVAALPSGYRNRVAVCAATSYLRRARRSLVAP